MSKLQFDYQMDLKYSNLIDKCHFTIKCIPGSSVRQQVEEYKIDIDPTTAYNEGTDSFGNHYIYGSVDDSHDSFTFHISGIVSTTNSYECEANENDKLIFSHPYGFSVPGDGIREYYKTYLATLDGNDLEKSVAIMNRLYSDFSYMSGSTDINTTAEEAWSQRKGVCQDYAHIMIALCHLAGITARYVCGLATGEGKSHAWVEIIHDNKWYGLDPTNNLLVWDQYIKLGSGRDASDCQINRGIIRGDSGTQFQTIIANVSAID